MLLIGRDRKGTILLIVRPFGGFQIPKLDLELGCLNADPKNIQSVLYTTLLTPTDGSDRLADKSQE